MGWVKVTEPYATAPKVPTPRPTESVVGPIDCDAGFAELTDVAATGELGLAGCDDLVVMDSAFTGCVFLTDGEMTIEGRRTTFDKCDLSRLRFADLRGCRVTGAKLVGTDFSTASLEDVVFDGCVLRYTNLRSARLERVAFIGCTFDDVDLFEAELIDVDFSGSSLKSVNVDRMKAKRVDLRDAKTLGLDAVRSLQGCLVEETQLQELAYSLAFAAGLGIESREDG